jgi:hypothetical protein
VITQDDFYRLNRARRKIHWLGEEDKSWMVFCTACRRWREERSWSVGQRKMCPDCRRNYHREWKRKREKPTEISVLAELIVAEINDAGKVLWRVNEKIRVFLEN